VELTQAQLTDFLITHPDMLDQFVIDNIDLGKQLILEQLKCSILSQMRHSHLKCSVSYCTPSRSIVLYG
jgi:hypothetical protein